MATQIAELRNVEGRIYNHESFGTVDGPGIRYVFFLQGCPLRCLYCHNPDSTPFDRGEIWTAGEVVDTILKYKQYIKSGGVTLSGGEPLAQPDFVIAILKLLKNENIHTALDTSGCYNPEDPKIKEALELVDLVILDIKSIDPIVSAKLSGMDNINALKTLEFCEKIQKPVWVRQVLLDEYTLDDGQMHLLAARLAQYSCIERIELLPFHKLGEPKWDLIDREYQLFDTPATTKDQVEHVRKIFSEHGLATS